MKDIKRCMRCILPESLPSVKLDRNGICNHCKTYDRLFSNWEDVKSQRKKEFEDLLQRAKRLNRNYDCLILLSGGKDSTYALYLCDKIYKLKCLCITFDNGFLVEQAKNNIKNALKATNADHIFYSINRNLMLKLYKLFLRECGNFCQVCMRGIELVQKIAEYYRIPIVISGTGKRVEYLSSFPELFQGGNLDFFKNVVKGKPIEKNVSRMFLKPYSWNIQRIIRISFNLLGINLIKHPSISLYNYIDADFDIIYNTLKRKMGWEKPEGKFEHMDCMLSDIALYINTLKFPEVTTTTFKHCLSIRLGLMTREEAINLEKNKLINPQIPQELNSFLSEIGMSKVEFESSVRDWRKMDKFRDKKKDAIESLYHRIVRF